MTLQTTFLEIMIFFLCVNGAILTVDNLADTPLKTPFETTGNVTGVTPPSFFNSTDNSATLSGNLTGLDTVSNSTIGGSGTLNPVDSLLFPLAVIQTFLDIITGGFIWQTLALFGMPEIFVYILQGIFGFLLVVSIIYYVTGR